jgi:hypothetical protein
VIRSRDIQHAMHMDMCLLSPLSRGETLSDALRFDGFGDEEDSCLGVYEVGPCAEGVAFCLGPPLFDCELGGGTEADYCAGRRGDHDGDFLGKALEVDFKSDARSTVVSLALE